MKLPRTKYEPTIANGDKRGLPGMAIRVLVSGSYGPVHTAARAVKGFNVPVLESLTWPVMDSETYVPVIIPNVPFSSIAALSYDSTPYSITGRDLPQMVSESAFGLADYSVYYQPEE